MSQTDRVIIQSTLLLHSALLAVVDHLYQLGNADSPESVLPYLIEQVKEYKKEMEALGERTDLL